MTEKKARHLVPALFLAAVAGSAGVFTGYSMGLRRAYLRDAARAEAPDVTTQAPASWQPAPAQAAQQQPHPEPPTGKALSGAETPAAPFALDVSQPLHITWPLDIGPDPQTSQNDQHLCLRARQGVNELQTPGAGKALYPFRLREDGTYSTWFHVRWVNDGVGSVECNNSWFAGFDDRPATRIGFEQWQTRWFWQPGPTVKLSAGTHWLRVELREDGVRMDRVVIAPQGFPHDSRQLDAIQPHAFHGFAGMVLPLAEQRRVQAVSCAALPTRSLVIGRDHVNEITVLASCQSQQPFSGTIDVHCPTAPGLTVAGDRQVTCSPASPFVRHTLILSFPEKTARRFHRVIVMVRDAKDAVIFRQTLRFIKPYVWAFLGPFRDQSGGQKKIYRYTGSIGRVAQPCDHNPEGLAARKSAQALGLQKLPLTSPGGTAAWRVVSDGSCCDWTGAVDLGKVYGKTGPAFAYAVTWIHAQKQLHHRSFTFQADDSGWLWINGQTAVVLPLDLPREANRLWTSAPLQPGGNPVVIKVTQNQRYWGFRFDVVDWHWQGRRGDVITGLEPEAWKR